MLSNPRNTLAPTFRRLAQSRSPLCLAEQTRLAQRSRVEVGRSVQFTSQAQSAGKIRDSCCFPARKQCMRMSTTRRSQSRAVRTEKYNPMYRSASSKTTSDSKMFERERKAPFSYLIMSRHTFLVGCGLGVFVLGVYTSMIYTSYLQNVKRSRTLSTPNDVSDRYNSLANSWDSEIDSSEWVMGMTRLRKKLVRQATGDVLEASVGTGRNLSYYDWDFGKHIGKIGKDNKIVWGKVKSFTAVDKSVEMVEVAREKFAKEYPGVKGLRWIVKDACESLPSPPLSADESMGNKGKKYDTIVQTFGLCSCPDPVRLLNNLAEHVEADGKILLLEHGRGRYEWINGILDGLAPHHADRYGCWWNRDIWKIVEESGLEIEECKRRHFGTTWYMVLKPKPSKLGEVEVEQKEKSRYGRIWGNIF